MIVKKIALAVLAATFASSANAGMDTVVHFANFSPYNVTVNFTPGDNTCWYDTTGDDDGRVQEYFGYYRRSAVSDKGYLSYMTAFNNSFGLTDLATITAYPMNTSINLGPATQTTKVNMVMFKGETSANLMGGCKDQTSSRGFDITLTDKSGNKLSQRHYVLSDPPGSAWTLSRTKVGSNDIEETQTLGSGGVGNPLEIAMAAGTVILTAVSLGTAGPEALAARALFSVTAREVAAYGVEMSVRGEFFSFVMTGAVVRNEFGRAAINWAANRATTVFARTMYSVLANGIFFVYKTQKKDGDPTQLVAGQDAPDYDSAGVDFSSPTITPLGGLPDQRSICTYQTSTLGLVTECRMVGVSLGIVADGSLIFAPLPSVGSGD